MSRKVVLALLSVAIAVCEAKKYRDIAKSMNYTLELAEENFANLHPTLPYHKVKEAAKKIFDLTMDEEVKADPEPNLMNWNCPTLPPRTPGNNIRDLHPADIGAIGGIGDSISTGCNAASTSIFNMKDWVGRSWILGGDGFSTASEVTTLANAFQHYTGKLPSLSYGSGNDNMGHNWAKDGAIAQDMVGQVKQLRQGFQDDLKEKYDTTWKFVNVLIGGNNLCVACDGGNGAKEAEVSAYLASVKAALDEINTFPKTFVAVSLMPDITQLQIYKSGLVCSVALWYACDCAASDDAAKRQVVQDLVVQYNKALTDMVNSYPDREDWAAVLQPSLQNAVISSKDLISEADCFHPSSKGQGGFATGLWNNLVEVAGKKTTWKDGDKMRCLTETDRLQLD